jgi:hypothetical protein
MQLMSNIDAISRIRKQQALIKQQIESLSLVLSSLSIAQSQVRFIVF